MKLSTLNSSVLAGLLVSMPVFAAPTVYIAVSDADEVIVLDGATDRIVGTISGLEKPHEIVATPDGQTLIAGSLQQKPMDDTNFSVIERSNGQVKFKIPMEGWSYHQVVTPDGRYVLSTRPSEALVRVVDLDARQVIKSIAAGSAANHLLLSNDGRYVFVSNEREDAISQIDLRTWSVTQMMSAGRAPGHMVMSPDGKLIYVTSHDTDQVSAVSVSLGEVVDSCRVGKGLHGIDVGDDGKTLFVSSRTDNKLYVLDASLQKKPQRMLELSPAPYHVKVIKGTGKVYVASHTAPKLWVIDQATLEVLEEIELPAVGHHMEVVY